MSDVNKRAKIGFKLVRDSDDYPPADWEHLWAIQQGSWYEIDNIPFFVKGVSVGDVVSVHQKNGELVFDEIIKFGGHSTIRVVMFNAASGYSLRCKLENLGCATEGSHLPNLFSVDVPPEVNYSEVIDLLIEATEKEDIDYEEASIQHWIN